MSRKREPDAPRRYDPDGRPVTSVISFTERVSHSTVFGRTSRMYFGRRQDAPLEARFVPAHDHIVSRPRPMPKDSHVHQWSVRGATVTRTHTAVSRTPVILVKPIPEATNFHSEADLIALSECWVAHNPADISGEYVPPVGCGWNYSEAAE